MATDRTAVRGTGAHRSLASGFTLIEIMVVMSLIVILATMGLVQYRQSIVRSKEAVLKEDLFRMRDAMDQYYADKGKYPESLDTLVSEHYIRAIPKDPITNTTSWQTVAAERDTGSTSSASPGIYDIKSESTDTALDGSSYQEW